MGPSGRAQRRWPAGFLADQGRQEGAVWALGGVSWASELGAEVLRKECACLVGRGQQVVPVAGAVGGVGAGRMGRGGFLT